MLKGLSLWPLRTGSAGADAARKDVTRAGVGEPGVSARTHAEQARAQKQLFG
jgi:hypothetical protein